ncbi:N-acetyl-gamma-glutamyl-phosphate reductase [bacterium]|nr:N-acetyl-gamma-glutamyl-phosphate reductase [bacterium]NIN91891.1 N-acetyl-gamma-glutamyl-phosphate reductase [bacterium]NIO18157.1 N-acetyl-gamma-glutamyl-phosphate reductase [bacterium]NIO73132.1 N-acetyl-gamma-glutamyl-phosphate reductase [bacterium]
MITVSIVGASGYTGRELIKILFKHPQVKIAHLTSETYKGKRISELHKGLVSFIDKKFEKLDIDKVAQDSDLVFLALPHGKSQKPVAEFLKKGKKIIDLSADYRLKDKSLYKRWYGLEHSYPRLLRRAVYGLPEIYKEEIKKSSLVANPGCYPTGVILGVAPLLAHRLGDGNSIIADAKSGVSGAGRRLDIAYHFSECHENLVPYNVGEHRHTPEIEQELSKISKKKITISFTPHLVPMDRGILSTIYVNLEGKVSIDRLRNVYKNYYRKAPFVKILPKATFPQARNVVETNFCEIGLMVDRRTKRIIIITAIDNLVKGASGQAVQNMNLMSGFRETEALL